MMSISKKIKKNWGRKLFSYIFVKFLVLIKVKVYKNLFSNNKPKLYNTKINLPTQFIGKGNIEINSSHLGVFHSPFFINGYGYLEARTETAKIIIGHGTAINNNFVMIADKSSVIIGCRCLIGPNFFVTDSDFHGIKVAERNAENYETSSVFIGDDVFIGDNVRVLKGVTIGAGSVIGSGAVVAKDVASNSVAIGVPAKVIRNI
jgi:acetyltransferase-like isoleucine patch superfamily enzyme